LGGTIDDAPGEAFDKVAKMLGLGFPGGPFVEEEAANGDAERFHLPRPLVDRPGCDMSFSGLKTAVVRTRDDLVAKQGGLFRSDIADLCASFQAAVAEVLAEKTRRAVSTFRDQYTDSSSFAVAGGVAANEALRARLNAIAESAGMSLSAPPLRLCTDNGAMIAWAGLERLEAGLIDQDVTPRPRWPLDQDSPSMLGSGKKGAKA
jgi:N6-L-threonylcarbamoyladenine synthase